MNLIVREFKSVFASGKIILDQRGLIGNNQTANKLFAACSTMHEIIPKCILAKVKTENHRLKGGGFLSV